MSQVPPEGEAEPSAPAPSDLPVSPDSAERPEEMPPDLTADQDAQMLPQAPGPDQVEPGQTGPSVVVRYGLMRQVGEFGHNLESAPVPGTKVIVRTERGVELGEVLASLCEQTGYGCIGKDRLSDYLAANGPDYPFRRQGKVLRLANPQDVIDQRHLRTSAHEETAFCSQQITELGLNMKLVAVEHLLGGERIIFYFSAESRIDFRQLVRRVASQYRTRIEMRQVGARDEARLVADFERCGRRCCCQQFLKYLQPVSMRMAKTQKATLDPTKISGRCGRLMCCLRFEDASYEELRQKLPRRNTYVRTAKVVGKVVDTQILTQLVRLQLPDGKQAVVANEEILQRDVPPSTAQPEKPAAVADSEPVQVEPSRPPEEPLAALDQAHEEPQAIQERAEEPAAALAESQAQQQFPSSGKKRRPRRRGRKRRFGQQPAAQGAAGGPERPAGPAAASPQPAAQGGSQGAQAGPRQQRGGRRRRRRH